MLVSIIVLLLYALVILIVASYAYRQTHNYQDYILGGRRFNGIFTAMGVAASDMSAWLMLSVPAVFYLWGLNQIWMPLGLLIGAFLNWHIIAPRLRVYTSTAHDSLTIPSFFQNRFFMQPKSALRVISSVTFLIFFTCYAASGFVGTAKLFASTFHLDYTLALYISAPIVILYTAIGGYLAVNWLDLLQGFLMLFALMFLAVFAGMHLTQAPINPVTFPDVNRYDIFYDVSFLSIISALGWGLGYFGQPHILSRFMSARNPKEIRLGKYICLMWMILAFVSAALIGIIGFYFFPIGTLTSAEIIFPELAQRLLPTWLSALVFAAIISAIMSTVSAVLFASASSLTEDIYAVFIHKHASPSKLVKIGRLAVFMIALVAAFIALQGETPSVFELVSHAWAGLGAGFGPIIVMSLLWRKMSYWGALLGLTIGGGVTLAWIICGYIFSAPIFNLYEIIPGFFAGIVGILVGTYLKPNQDSQVKELHERYLTRLKELT